MKNKFLSFLVIFWVVLGAGVLSENYYQLMIIQGNSMSPSYHNMQLVILDKHSKDYKYGDVIAYQCERLNSVLVKRIVACPGDTLIIKNGTLYVNGEISEIFPSENIFDYSGLAENEILLAEDSYFVIGDNISESKDSRYEEVGCVNHANIIGEVMK